MCNYNFDLPIDPLLLMPMVQQMIEENGGTVSGQMPHMAVSFKTPMGPVAGSCRHVGGSLISLTVTKKPEVLTCKMVRERLITYISEAVRLYAEQEEAAASSGYAAVGLEQAAAWNMGSAD